MSIITDYMIIEAQSLNDLVKEVQVMIEDGWQPHGGLVTVENLTRAQAMVKCDWSWTYDLHDLNHKRLQL